MNQQAGTESSLIGPTMLLGATVAIALFLLAQVSTTAGRLPVFYELLLKLDRWPAALALFVTASGLLRPLRAVGVRVAEMCGQYPIRVAAITFFFLCLVSRFAYFAHPVSMDEYSAFFQSELFARGRLSTRIPIELLDWVIPAAFHDVFFVVSHRTGEVASIYMPGFALLLTPFTAAGIPWACNPLLGAASVLIVHRIARELFFDVRNAGLAVLLTIGSTAFTVNAASYYSMTAHALLNGIFALLLLRPTPLRSMTAGLVGSFALVLHNPVPHTLFALPWLCWLLLRPDRLKVISAILTGYLPLFLLLGIGWSAFAADIQQTALTSTPETLGTVSRWSTSLALLLRVPSGEIALARAAGFAKLFIWSVPVLLVASIAGTRRRWDLLPIRLMSLSCACTLVGYLFVVFTQGHGWGFRYFHSAWLCLPILAVAAVTSRSRTANDESFTRFGAISAMAIVALLSTTPLQLWQVRGFVASHLAQIPISTAGKAKIIVVDGTKGYYAADLVQNDPFLRNAPLYFISHGRTNDEALMKTRYPELTRLSDQPSASVWGLRDSTLARD